VSRRDALCIASAIVVAAATALRVDRLDGRERQEAEQRDERDSTGRAVAALARIGTKRN